MGRGHASKVVRKHFDVRPFLPPHVLPEGFPRLIAQVYEDAAMTDSGLAEFGYRMIHEESAEAHLSIGSRDAHMVQVAAAAVVTRVTTPA